MESIEDLIDAAASGKRLHCMHRRRAIRHLIETGQWTSNRKQAKFFQVHERMVRKDRKALNL
jgi:hypothetical protein